MPRYRRQNAQGSTWFFTIVTYKRRAFLCGDEVCTALRCSIKKVQTKYPFKIEAWVLLPDHFHCIWTLPDQDSNFQLRISLMKRYVTQSCAGFLHQESLNTPSRRKRKESTIWQRRFWEHQIQSEKDLKTHMDYIHYNPVKHELCQSPIEWPYSTIHRLTKEGVYPENWASDPNTTSELRNYGEHT
ncbi:MAG: transposase [Sulfitobacter sp.]|nr:transposase [Sulfitobacter sp.]